MVMATRTLFLLHHLVLGQPPEQPGSPPAPSAQAYLVSRLANQRHVKAFSGVHHMFHVALGRFSYADVPDWLPRADRADFGGMQGVIRAIVTEHC
jgi:hypothetical protein